MTAGAQYPVRLTVPPRHVPFTVVAMDWAVEFAFTFVLPQNTCRCAAPGWPGKTIGSSLFMCEYWHTVRKALTRSPDGVGISPVRTTRSTGDPGTPFGILFGSKGSPEPCSCVGDGDGLADFDGDGLGWPSPGSAGPLPTLDGSPIGIGPPTGRHAVAARTTRSAAEPTTSVVRERSRGIGGRMPEVPPRHCVVGLLVALQDPSVAEHVRSARRGDPYAALDPGTGDVGAPSVDPDAMDRVPGGRGPKRVRGQGPPGRGGSLSDGVKQVVADPRKRVRVGGVPPHTAA